MIKLDYNINPDDIIKESEIVQGNISDAVLSASYEIMKRSQMNLKSTPYKLDEVARDGILVGKLKKDKHGSEVKVHGFGTKGKGYLARIFITGTVERHGRGYIKGNDAISNALDQDILDRKINDVL